jgi:Tfp pilus assembly protein PilF
MRYGPVTSSFICWGVGKNGEAKRVAVRRRLIRPRRNVYAAVRKSCWRDRKATAMGGLDAACGLAIFCGEGSENMSRLHFLGGAGVLLLPAGCITLPSGDVMAYKTALLKSESETSAVTDPSSAQAAKVCLATAQTLEKKGQDKEALLEYERARKQNPHLVGVAWRLAVLYNRQGNVERARTEYQIALGEQPSDADLLNDIGYFCYEQRQNREAESYLRQALAINPNHKRAWVNLGKVLAQQDRYEESCEAFGQVVRPAQAAANVGILLAKEGKVAEARQVLHKALTLEPDLKAARLVLTQLEAAAPPEVRLTLE